MGYRKMANQLPLLVFPQAKSMKPPKGKGFPPTKPHFPSHDIQIIRLAEQISTLELYLNNYKAKVSGVMSGFEPETVLVIEIAGQVDHFKQAVEAAGLEWLGEWDLEDIDPDDEFYEINSKGERADKKISGRLFLSFINESSLRDVLSLWNKWKNNISLPIGLTKWRDVFSQIVVIRPWGIQETLGETGMLDLWRDILDPINPNELIKFQIEFFYRSSKSKRNLNETIISSLLAEIDGNIIGSFIDMPEIAFHAAKAQLPARQISRLLDAVNLSEHVIDIQLFNFSGVMYFRPTGQSLAIMDEGEGEPTNFSDEQSTLSPIAAILDGVPNLQHDALKDRLLYDDPNNLEELYQPGERRHGTSMASLIIHGELDESQASPLSRQLYFHPIMQPDPNTPNRDEHVPEDIFLEDRIYLAVRRMFEGQGDVPAQAPNVKIINLSIGDIYRPFIRTISPLARLLDWLSWKYRVLFCVSSGNYCDKMDLNNPDAKYLSLPKNEQVIKLLQCVEKQLSERRLLSPAEAMNVLTVGALHSDSSGEYLLSGRVDILPDSSLFSPITRLGYGFRRSIKPEIWFPGGRQLYREPITGDCYTIDRSKRAPGQRVAWDSSQQGELSMSVYTRGTSNATALATRGGALLYDTLQALQTQHGENIPDSLISVLIKTLLVHGARHGNEAKKFVTQALRTPRNSKKMKEVLARYLGYGGVDIQRVLSCTEQRGTVLGCNEIKENEIHEYRFPLPPGLADKKEWRRLVITLAWFTPINPNHRNLREAKLDLSSSNNWSKSPLKLSRQDADHNQVHRGTVQHEVLEGNDEIQAYQDGTDIILHVLCKADGTNKLDISIPYGLAVTLEVQEGVNIPIYQEIKARIRPRVSIGI